jgi:hypothetical protein
MTASFSGEPLTRWDGPRNMILEEDFFFIDAQGKKWSAPKGSCLNGATIPKALWSTVGAPYSGCYRRASVVHDVAVGELCNPDVTYSERKKADRMFYHACRHDGCNRRFATILYMGVKFGTWASGLESIFKSNELIEKEFGRDNPEDKYMASKFWGIVDASSKEIESEDLDALDEIIEKKLSSN